MRFTKLAIVVVTTSQWAEIQYSLNSRGDAKKSLKARKARKARNKIL